MKLRALGCHMIGFHSFFKCLELGVCCGGEISRRGREAEHEGE